MESAASLESVEAKEVALKLNHLDVRLHNAAKRKFERRIQAYEGGAKGFALDVKLFRRSRFTFAAACLTCLMSEEQNLPNLPPSLRQFPCDSLKANAS